VLVARSSDLRGRGDNVVYWKTKGKINNDLQCARQISLEPVNPSPGLFCFGLLRVKPFNDTEKAFESGIDAVSEPCVEKLSVDVFFKLLLGNMLALKSI